VIVYIRRMRLRWVLLLLSACSGGASKPPPEAPKPVVHEEPKPPPKPACVQTPEGEAAITHASVNGGRVQYCVGTVVDQCFALDLASGALTHLDAPPAATAEPNHIETTNPDLKVCTGDQCKSLTPQVWPGTAPLHAATNGQFAVVLLGDAEHGQGYAEVYDVQKAKKVASIRYARGDWKCGEVQMLGETIYIGASTCTSPSGRAALYTTKGRKIANVGPRDFGTYGNSVVQVDGNTWAFLGENGAHVALQDVVKGKVVKTIDVSDLWRKPSDAPPPPPKDAKAGKAAAPAAPDAFGNPGESALVQLEPGKLAVIAGTPMNGSVAVVDVASGEVKVTRAPLCP
jgi:hypothetical protein